LDGRVALITGAARGLGAGIAHHFAKQGAAVALMGRSAAPLEEVSAAIRAETDTRPSVHLGDVGKAEDAARVVQEVIDRHLRIDLLVNNAGIVDQAAFLDITVEGWNSVIATNLSGVFLMTQSVARRMRDSGGGAVVNIASIDAYGTDGPQASYTAAKAGLIGLTKAAATELAPLGIRVNSVSPGWTRTKMVEEFVTATALEHMLKNFTRVPMRRMVEIDEVAAAVAFLASSAASGITGIDVPVDCGTLANLFVYETLPD
jgi:NAD(P)-dependent dehydrogenase (short-subunit alcohol dehydrogenase family)